MISAVILSGGHSTRMGEDKANYKWLQEHTYAHLGRQEPQHPHHLLETVTDKKQNENP